MRRYDTRAPVGSSANPLIVPPAMYDAIKADPRFRDVHAIPTPMLPLHGVVIVRDDD